MAVKEHRRRELVLMTRRQIARAIEDDLNGELIMKEVWEECGELDEQRIVEDEMRDIIATIEARP